ncbi:hypothetical protein [uncultured Flavobacterium sp.]|uniref:hypothetical protein n=1 Tax=uncultured Flavobacterium sp. TaxID=165435 RepID=UPI0030CA52A1
MNYLNQINQDYKNVLDLMDEVHFKGIDYIIVSTKNETNMIIPSHLQYDLLDFSTYGMNNPEAEM